MKYFSILFLCFFTQIINCSELKCTKVLGKIIKYHNLYTTHKEFAIYYSKLHNMPGGRNHGFQKIARKLSIKSDEDQIKKDQHIFLFELYGCEKYEKLKEKYTDIINHKDKEQ